MLIDSIDRVRTLYYIIKVKFDFSEEKNEILFKKRNITFYKVIETIAEKGILLDFENPNKGKYPKQRILVVAIENYIYCIPYVMEGDTMFLKTIYPCRKFKYLIGGKRNG